MSKENSKKFTLRANKYTFEECAEFAKDCDSGNQLRHKNREIYDICFYKNWLPLFTWFRTKSHPSKYTEEVCYEIAKKYTTLKDFIKNERQAYNFAQYNGWIDNYTWLERKNKAKRWWWDYNNCYEEAKKYKTINEFHNGSRHCYEICRDNRWLEDFYWLSKEIYGDDSLIDYIYVYRFEELNSIYVGRTINPQRRHKDHKKCKTDTTLLFCQEHGLEFPQMEIIEDGLTIKQGLEREDYYVQKFKKDGWNVLNKMKTGIVSGSAGYLTRHWTYETCYEEAKKYKTRKEFCDNARTAYDVARVNGWIDDYDWMPLTMKPHGYWDVFENVTEVAKKYRTRNELHYSKDSGAYDGALRNGWLDILYPIKGNVYWTYEKCKEVASQCSTRSEFGNRYVGAYDVARKNGWLDELIPNSRNKYPINYWNDKERCREEASKYKGRGEFIKKSPTAYRHSRINGWLDEFFGTETLPHTPKSLIQHWTDETCIEEMKKYRNRTELRRKKTACHRYAKEHNLLEIVYGKMWSKK